MRRSAFLARLNPVRRSRCGSPTCHPSDRPYYDGWRIAGKPFDERQPAEFATFVAADLPPSLAHDALRVTRAVFGLLEKELDRGETEKIIATLPHPLRALWLAPKSQETPPL